MEERIERIAETLGYAMGFALSKAFTRIAGVSPQHHRLQATGWLQPVVLVYPLALVRFLPITHMAVAEPQTHWLATKARS